LAALFFTACFAIPHDTRAQTRATTPATNPPPIVLTVEGTNVWIQRFASNNWEFAYPSQILRVKDRGRTGVRSRTTIRLSDLSVTRIGERSEFEIEPLPDPEVEAEFSLFKGLLYLFHRDKPGSHRFKTPTATAATRGTEFALEVEETTGRTILTVLEGKAELSNAIGSILLASGEQGIAALGQRPFKTAVIETINVVQWCLYYPGVLDLDELELAPEEETALGASLAAYRRGDLLQAVANYPSDRVPRTDYEKVYLAALLLAVGQVPETEALLDSFATVTTSEGKLDRLANAIRRVIAAVKLQPAPSTLNSQLAAPLATEWLAESYVQQSAFRLVEALKSARMAVKQSPQFAFAWARVAELEFSQGSIEPAFDALEKSLVLAPRNAQALALKGFLLSAQNRIDVAIGYFEQAMAIDGGLGNAWLGRGLCRIRRGDARAGRLDLQVAATLEAQRALLRSYLGKAFNNSGDSRRSENELKLARHLDAGDPTPWLYSALLLQQGNRINEAVRDLEQSQTLNDNRRVYRSRLLLDQDRAVRGANLASVYRDAGMTDVSVREAARAVNADYANYSAHLFLANSFNELRDIKQINLRYETAWFNEYLLANLLAPVGAGTLSQSVSQQEYSKLFERDRPGFSSSTDYLSHGEWVQSGVQYGTFGNSSYAAEVFYHSDDGTRPNSDLEQLATVLNVKQQLTPQDGLYLRVSYYNANSGDVNQYYNQSSANTGLRTKERQEPVVLCGYHHEWSPGNHTLLLVGRLQDRYAVDNPSQNTLLLNRGSSGTVNAVLPLFYEQDYQYELEIFSAELQQLWQRGNHTLVLGGRFQSGNFNTENKQSNGEFFDGSTFDPIPFQPDQKVKSGFERTSAYAYDQWQVWPNFLLIGGLTYDRLRFPENYRYAPITDAEETRDRLSPKGGVILTLATNTTVRAAYFQGLGGVSLDQSVRLEPSQVAGFNQAFRSVIPEAVAGANAAPVFESWVASFEQKFGRGTYFGVSGEALESEVDRRFGVVEFFLPPVPGPGFSVAGTREQQDFRERSLTFTLNQLVGEEWSLGARYRISNVKLDDEFPDIPDTAFLVGGFQRTRHLEATLHQLQLSALFNHPSGFFARGASIWTAQSNRGYAADRPGDDFWQFNLEAGWRFARRRAEVRVALLNLTDEDYRLNPLNLASELPRERTVAVSLQFNF
jgi:Tfp pilus assembly protein PilF